MVDDMGIYIMSKTKIDQKLFNKNKSKDWYLSDREQVELGIANKIVTSLDEIL